MIHISGAMGVIRWGYQSVAIVRDWTITRAEDKTLCLAGTVEDVDTYAVSQPRLRFQVTHEKGSWRWPIERLQIEGASCSATLGPKESR